MDFFDLIQHRRSVRTFTGKPLPEASLRSILEATNRAPSAGDRQAYEVVVIRDDARKTVLAAAAFGQDFLIQAPVVLAFCANPVRSSVKYRERGATLYAVQDATIACTFAHLAATALGLGSVWVGAFDEALVAKALEIPADWRPVALLPVGYPAESPAATPRRRLEDLVHQRQ